ncbi:lectin-like [Asparagus officinalis]|uniref:lectin-like n=1 Tax=Asparagus officinalis TaxID=4686 RepID=UPI00098DFC70|nr:lectin-like [Asparagus officinalis]
MPVINNSGADIGGVIVTARELSIAWSNDPNYWKWVPIDEGEWGEEGEIAELIQVSWLDVEGRVKMQNLEEGREYEVMFLVIMGNIGARNFPVILKLIANGEEQEKTVDLNNLRDKGELVSVSVGKFAATSSGDVAFSLANHDSSLKEGLSVKGAIIESRS